MFSKNKQTKKQNKKNSFIKKSVKQSKIKNVKNIIIKKVNYEFFSSI